MSIIRKAAAILLCLAMLTGLAACGTGKDREPVTLSGDGDNQGGMIEGYIPSEIPLPENIRMVEHLTTADGLLYLSGYVGNGPGLVCYDPAQDSWRQILFDTTDLGRELRIWSLSAAEGAVWALLENLDTQPWTYYLLRCEEGSDNAERIKVDFAPKTDPRMGDAMFAEIVALDKDRVILGDFVDSYVLDRDMKVLQTLSGNEISFHSFARCGSRLLCSRDENGLRGVRSFDMETLTAGDFLPLDELPMGESDNGHFLCQSGGSLAALDPGTGAVSPLFDWADVALSSSALSGCPAVEDAEGNFYYCDMMAGCLTKVSPGLIPNRQVITLASFGSGAFVDNVLRFNNTDPEYKIKLQLYDRWKEGEQQRFIRDVTLDAVPDIVDTAWLPEGSRDGTMLTDLMPYLDADPELSREDFIQPLLNSMIQNGHLYELTPKFTLLTLCAHPDQFPGREGWTVDYLRQLIERRPEETKVFFWYLSREQILGWLCKAAAGEYVDWENASCRFDCDSFRDLLALVKDIPYGGEYTEDGVLLYPTVDGVNGKNARTMLQDEYVFAGLPGTEGTGSYFIKLSKTDAGSMIDVSMGSDCSLAITAASPNKDAAWRFLRQLLLPGTQQGGFYGEIGFGIPVVKDSFEKVLDNSIGDREDPFAFRQEDADKLRELVYATDKMAREDPMLQEIIQGEAAAYFAGQQSLEDTARLIQSRASLYLAEQYGG